MILQIEIVMEKTEKSTESEAAATDDGNEKK